ncbi:peptidase inhibitor 16 isoform X1 [Oncorhynchus mykiss]|uniref:SCP domain-containing protein n=1 Tax=Oncorhynchus mykiss TaxID=8022 RepID=A0A8K9Y2H4_ONCMY|nr:peptidase inhibitor 16 isoform X1 [Oncorhynchus mykiss]
MLWGTALLTGLVGLYVIVTQCPATCQLSQEDTETLMELHNSYRGQVVPSATYMRKVKWDEKLKILAEGYAVKCMWEPNPDLELLNMGENLFVSNEPLDLNMTMEKWFLEHLDYDYNNNSCQEDRMCGHYTQMVWADSHSVGCAAHRCDTIEGLSFEKVNFLVCNYYPKDKFKDEKPYEQGEWCSKCPDNVPQCDQNLCVPYAPESSDEPDVEEPDAPDPSDKPDVEEPDALEPSEEPDVEKETTESSTPHRELVYEGDETGTEPGDEEDEEETGTEPGDEEETGTQPGDEEDEEETGTQPGDEEDDKETGTQPGDEEETGTEPGDEEDEEETGTHPGDEEETGMEPGDEEEEEEWEGEERAAEREKERTRNQPPANAGKITTPLLLVTSLMALLSVGL